MYPRLLVTAAIGLRIILSTAVCRAGEAEDPAWAKAHLEGPLSADETRQFMHELAKYVFDNHLKQKADSPQRGIVYEYFDVRRKGQVDQFPEGEALDTMHDGAWFAAAMVNAYRVTGEPFYKDFLTRWQLPFYLKMLNHSDTLFTGRRNDARPTAKPWGREWAFQEGEKGFVPYFWDDGGSVSIERRLDKNPLGIAPCADNLAGKPNPNFVLDGYSLGSSNHMAQDLGVMVQLAWLLLRESTDPADQKLAAEVAEGAKNLHECRVRHNGPIPMCATPAGLAIGDAKLLAVAPGPDEPRLWDIATGCYGRGLYTCKPGDAVTMPAFADNEEYRHCSAIARSGGAMAPPLAFRTIYDALSNLLMYRAYCDDWVVPAGINRGEQCLHVFRGGKLGDYRSDRKGHYKRPKPVGSRMGPQNMIVCGWALQALRAYPGIWEERYRRQFAEDLRVFIDAPLPTGKRFAAPAAAVELAGVPLRLLGTRNALLLDGTFAGEGLTVKLFSRPDLAGSHADITLNKQGTASALNDAGEKLIMEAEVKPVVAGTHFKLNIPYTIVKGQQPWLNGIEHGRYSIAIGPSKRNFYLASNEEQVHAWLEHELGAGLRTWRAIFRQLGYIPTVLNHGEPWDHYSDTGGYAHLISAGAQWVFYLEGKRDWEVHHAPKIVAKKP